MTSSARGDQGRRHVEAERLRGSENVVCGQTVGNVLQRYALPPVPERKRTTTWAAFIRIHLALLAGKDFFTAEVLTLRGLMTYYVLFFIHFESRRVDIAGITVHPEERWMQQIARNAASLVLNSVRGNEEGRPPGRPECWNTREASPIPSGCRAARARLDRSRTQPTIAT